MPEMYRAGKLGMVLFQFPPWFYSGSEQWEYILSCKERLPQCRISVEFRHNSWLNEKNLESTVAFLKDNNLPYVCVDEPQGFDSSVPPTALFAIMASLNSTGTEAPYGYDTEYYSEADES